MRHCYKNFQDSSVTQYTNTPINGTEMKTQERSNSESLNENRIEISDFNGERSLIKEQTSDLYITYMKLNHIYETNKKEAAYRY